MATNRTISALLQYRVDQNSIKSVTRSTDTVRDSLRDLSPVAQSSVRGVRRSFDDMQAAVKENIEFVDSLRRSLERLDDVDVKPEIDIEEVKKRNERVRQSIGDISTFSGSIASVIGGSSGGGQIAGFLGDLSGSIEYVSLFRKGIKEVGDALLETGGVTTRAVQAFGKAPVAIASLGAAAVAVVALGVAIDQFNKQVDGSKKFLTAAIAAQDAYYEALRDSTTEQARATIAELQRTTPLLAQQAAETRAAADAAFAQYAANFGDAAARLLDNQSPVGQLREQAEKLEAELGAANQTINRFTAGIEANAFAANDAAAAQQALNEFRRQEAQAIIAQAERQRQNYLEDVQLLEGTSEAAKARRDELNNEIFALRNLITTLRETGNGTQEVEEEIAAYRQQLEQLAEDERRLTLVTLPLIQAREAEAAATERVNSAVGNFIGGIRNGIGTIADSLKRFDDAAIKNQLQLDKLSRARNDSLVKLAEKLNNDIARLNEDFNEQQRRDGFRRSEELAKFQTDERRRTEDFYRSLRDIRSKFDMSARRAVAKLDAESLQQSIEQRDQELAEESEQNRITNERRQEDLQDLIRNLDFQDAERARDYQKRYSQLISANQAERSATDAKYRADVLAAQQNFLLTTGLLNQEVLVRRNTNNTILSDLSQYANQARSILGSIFNFNRTPSNAIIPDYRIISQEQAQREIAERNRQQQLGAQSLVTAGASGGGTTNNSITINGLRLTPAELLRVLKEALS